MAKNQREEIGRIISKVEKQLGRSGGIRSTTFYRAQKLPADGGRERKFTGHLKIDYDAIMASIRDAESILILGPGEAKIALRRQLERENPGGCIVGMETNDKMTDRQIAAKMRKYFQKNSRE
jgi:hypothetical protein